MNKSIKLLSLNVSLFDENNEKLTRFLKEITPDIIALQEVTRKVDKTALDAFVSKEEVDKATPRLLHSFYSPNWVFKDFRQENFHGKKVFEHDFGGLIEAGNYIKSRFEILDAQGIFVQGNFSFVKDWEENLMHPGEEPRMVQVADLKLNSNKLRILNYHGIWSRDKRDSKRKINASKKLLDLAKINYPAIICGDFNLFPDTESIKILNGKFVNLVDKFDVKTTRPEHNELNHEKRNVVDYIFISKDIKVNEFEVIKTDISDHFPILLEFDI